MSYRSTSFHGQRNYSHNIGKPNHFGFKRKSNKDDFKLPRIDWRKLNLAPIKKIFYKEHINTTNLAPSEVSRIRSEKEITVSKNAPKPVRFFPEASLPPYITKGFDQLGFKEPTPIQSQSWPVIMGGHDMIGIAETGSGKTLSFLVPSIIHINSQNPVKRGEGPIALVIAPTRELAQQTERQIQTFGQSSQLRYTCVYGGVPKGPQVGMLKRGVDIVVATPGRLLDFMSTNVTNLHRVTYLVLDEADRMLDMGFEKPIRQILSQIRPDRQTVMFSATWPKAIQKLAYDILTNPIQVNIGSLGISSCKNVDQKFEVIPEHSKMMKREKNEKVLIFAATKRKTGELCRELNMNGFHSGSISGDRTQYERESILNQFKQGGINILVGTDVASRGIDIRDIGVVINYDFPNTIEDYVHRIGRTGRANRTGNSYTLVTKKDSKKIGDLVTLLKNDKKEIPREIQQLQCFNQILNC